MKHMSKVAVGVLSAVLASSAFAADQGAGIPSQGFYIGAGLGGGSAKGASGVAGLFNLGFQFSSLTALEFGTQAVFAHRDSSNPFNETIRAAEGIYVAAKFMLPLSNKLQLFGKIGGSYNYYLSNQDFFFNAFNPNDPFGSGVGLLVGGGASYYFTPHFSLDGFIQSSIYKHTYTFVGVGASFHF